MQEEKTKKTRQRSKQRNADGWIKMPSSVAQLSPTARTNVNGEIAIIPLVPCPASCTRPATDRLRCLSRTITKCTFRHQIQPLPFPSLPFSSPTQHTPDQANIFGRVGQNSQFTALHRCRPLGKLPGHFMSLRALHVPAGTSCACGRFVSLSLCRHLYA